MSQMLAIVRPGLWETSPVTGLAAHLHAVFRLIRPSVYALYVPRMLWVRSIGSLHFPNSLTPQ